MKTYNFLLNTYMYLEKSLLNSSTVHSIVEYKHIIRQSCRYVTCTVSEYSRLWLLLVWQLEEQNWIFKIQYQNAIKKPKGLVVPIQYTFWKTFECTYNNIFRFLPASSLEAVYSVICCCCCFTSLFNSYSHIEMRQTCRQWICDTHNLDKWSRRKPEHLAWEYPQRQTDLEPMHMWNTVVHGLWP